MVRQVFVMLVMVLGAWIAAVPATAQAGSGASALGGGPKASDSSLVTPSDIPGSECIVSSSGVPFVIAGASVQVTATVTTAATESGTTCTQSSTPITSGTITIQVLSNSCAGAVIASASYPLNGTNSVTESLSTGAGSNLPAGAYAFSSTYDAGNGATSPSCGTVPVHQATPSITQTVQDVPLGAGTQDTAKVTGGDSPTGTVTMGLYSNSGCTSVVYSNTQTLSGGTATSASYTPTKAGTYYWSARYNGDTNNLGGSSGCEAVNVGKVAPSVTTSLNGQGATIAVASQTVVTDVATVSGGFNVNTGGGTVRFAFYSSLANCQGATSPVYTSGLTAPTGAPSTATSGTFTPAAAGTYYVSANYSGDTNNAPASETCSETFTVGAPPITTTTTTTTSTPATRTVPATVTLSLSSSKVTAGTSTHATIGVSGPAGFAPGTLYVHIYASPTCDAAQVAVATSAINETTGVQDSFGTGTGGLKAGQYGVQAAYQGGTGGVEATGSSACVPLTVVSLDSCQNVDFIGARGSGEPPKQGARGPGPAKQGAGFGVEIYAVYTRMEGDLPGLSLTPTPVLDGYLADSVDVLYPSGGEEALIAAALRGGPLAGPLAVLALEKWKANHLDHFIASINSGTTAVLAYVRAEESRCPSTAIVLAGYSQGAMAIHQAELRMTKHERAHVAGTILLADGDRVGLTDAEYTLGSSPRDGEGIRTYLRANSRQDVPIPRTTVDICNIHDLVCDFTAGSIRHHTADGKVHTTYLTNSRSLLNHAADLIARLIIKHDPGAKLTKLSPVQARGRLH
jgi:hypothetical protein